MTHSDDGAVLAWIECAIARAGAEESIRDVFAHYGWNKPRDWDAIAKLYHRIEPILEGNSQDLLLALLTACEVVVRCTRLPLSPSARHHVATVFFRVLCGGVETIPPEESHQPDTISKSIINPFSRSVQ